MSGKEDNFIAGADINMFTKCKVTLLLLIQIYAYHFEQFMVENVSLRVMTLSYFFCAVYESMVQSPYSIGV